MARIARIVVPHMPHHVTQRGARDMPVFFEDADCALYLSLVAEWAIKAGVTCAAYCLLPTAVHLLLIPSDNKGLRAALGEAHRRYTRAINARNGWRGHLWQERFLSCAIESGAESHALRDCIRYIERAPVLAGLVTDPLDWPWSSARPHAREGSDPFLTASLVSEGEDWAAFLAQEQGYETVAMMESALRTGRPRGGEGFLQAVETTLGVKARPGKPGRPVRSTTKV